MAGVNQVFLGAVKIMDISDSTVTPETLGDGATAYDKTGEKITGTMTAGVDLSGDTVTSETLIEGIVAHDRNSKPIIGVNPYELNATNSEVSEQASLISQIKTALEGKAAGGSGGGSIETCTVEVSNSVGNITTIVYDTFDENGVFKTVFNDYGLNSVQSFTATNVICGTSVVMYGYFGYKPAANIEGDAEFVGYGNSIAAIQVNGDAKVTMYDAD